MALNFSGNEISLVGNQPVAAAVLQQLRVARHGAQAPTEIDLLMRLHVEQRGEALERHRHTLLGEHLENVFPAGQGIVVFRQFPFDHGIGAADAGKFVVSLVLV